MSIFKNSVVMMLVMSSLTFSMALAGDFENCVTDCTAEGFTADYCRDTACAHLKDDGTTTGDRGFKKCLKWEKQEVCHVKQVCKWICTGAVVCTGLYCGVPIPPGIPGAMCDNVCEDIPDCHTITVCAEWEEINPPQA